MINSISELYQLYLKENSEFYGNSLRFGQWWMNKYYPNYENSKLFYEKDNAQAMIMIYKLMVEWNVI